MPNVLSVGTIAALLGLVALILATAVHTFCEKLIRRFVILRFRMHGRTPLVLSEHMAPEQLPISVWRYKRYPSIFLAFLFTFLFVLSELLLEWGVDVKENCGPIEVKGKVVMKKQTNEPPGPPEIEIAPAALMLQRMEFLDGGDIPYLVAGHIPRNPTPSFSTKHIPSPTPENAILSNCTVINGTTFEAGALSIAIRKTDKSFGTITESFHEIGRNNFSVPSNGDLTHNSLHQYTTFVFTENEFNNSVTYFEYANQRHIQQLFEKASLHKGELIVDKTRSSTYTQHIRCQENALTMASFRRALVVYRSIHVENPFSLARFHPEEERFQIIEAADVIYAVTSLKIAEDVDGVDDKDGTYYMYYTCGTFDWIFAIPALILLCAFIFLGLFSVVYEHFANVDHLHCPIALHSTPLSPVAPAVPSYLYEEAFVNPNPTKRRIRFLTPEIIIAIVDDDHIISSLELEDIPKDIG